MAVKIGIDIEAVPSGALSVGLDDETMTAASGGGGGFKPAFARGSNVVLTSGARATP